MEDAIVDAKPCPMSEKGYAGRDHGGLFRVRIHDTRTGKSAVPGPFIAANMRYSAEARTKILY